MPEENDQDLLDGLGETGTNHMHGGMDFSSIRQEGGFEGTLIFDEATKQEIMSSSLGGETPNPSGGSSTSLLAQGISKKLMDNSSVAT
jgi:hypothetical protein